MEVVDKVVFVYREEMLALARTGGNEQDRSGQLGLGSIRRQ